MKSSDYRQNMLTSFKNGKIGLFRERTTRDDLTDSFTSGVDVYETGFSTIWIGDYIEVHFGDDKATDVEFKFDDYTGKQYSHKTSKLEWLDYSRSISFTELRNIVVDEELDFKIRFTDENLGIHF